MSKRFSDLCIRNIKPQASCFEVWEGNGLGIRVSPAGAKAWVMVYHHEGRSRRYTGVCVAGKPKKKGRASWIRYRCIG